MIGKRKRQTSVVSRAKKGNNREDSPEKATTEQQSAQDIFRKFFEAQFEPLEVKETSTTQHESESESDDDGENGSGADSESESESESEWSGIDGAETENTPVEVVEYQAPSRGADNLIDKKARKAFMVSLDWNMREIIFTNI